MVTPLLNYGCNDGMVTHVAHSVSSLCFSSVRLDMCAEHYYQAVLYSKTYGSRTRTRTCKFVVEDPWGQGLSSRTSNTAIRRPSSTTCYFATVLMNGTSFNRTACRHTELETRLSCWHHEILDFIPPDLWPPNSPDLKPINYYVWSLLQERVYQTVTHVKPVWTEADTD